MSGKTVSDFFDSYAQDFNAIYGTSNSLANRGINKIFRRSMRLRFEKTIAGCSPTVGKRVIDIGCGPGHYAVTLAQRGAESVLGLDFADGMIALARENARRAGVANNCRFVVGDFLEFTTDEPYDYAILMGFMDYIEDPKQIVDKVRAITKGKAFFSFPAAGGLLAWQRQLRYRSRCPLFLYTDEQLRRLFSFAGEQNVRIERAARDYFVTLFLDVKHAN